MNAQRKPKRSIAPSSHQSGTHVVRRRRRSDEIDQEKVDRLRQALANGELEIDVELIAARIVDE